MTTSRKVDHKLATDELLAAAASLGLSLSPPSVISDGWTIRQGFALLYAARDGSDRALRLAVRCWLLGYAAAVGARV